MIIDLDAERILGKVKLNTDGSVNVNASRASFGGVFRNERGEWISGYFGYIGNATIMTAEVWSIHKGLKLAVEKNWGEVIVETDSKAAVELIIKDMEEEHPLAVLIKECRKMLKFLGGVVQHSWREGNMVADCLAKLGGQQNNSLVVVDKPSTSVNLFVLADMAGTMYPRP